MSILIECPICLFKQAVKNKKCKCGQDLDKAKRSGRVKYWINYRLPDGKQRRESVSAMEGLNGFSIEDAKIALSKRLIQKKENRILDIIPESKITFNKLTEWYLNLESVKDLKSFKTVRIYIGKFNKVFGNTQVSDIKPADLENLQSKRRKEGLRDKSIDDEINYVKTMVIKGFDNGKVGGDVLRVFRRIKKQLKGHANTRGRVLTLAEFHKLLSYCPRHLKDILTIGYWTGMRKGEITALTWDKLDMKNKLIKLDASDTKEDKAKVIPMSTDVYNVLKNIPVSIHDPHVFLYYGKPITRNFSQGLKSACKKAEIKWGRDEKDGFIFHDLRHTFITDMRRAQVDRTVRMSITGHAIQDMDQRYDVVEMSDKKAAIKQLEDYRSTQFANVDQSVDHALSL